MQQSPGNKNKQLVAAAWDTRCQPDTVSGTAAELVMGRAQGHRHCCLSSSALARGCHVKCYVLGQLCHYPPNMKRNKNTFSVTKCYEPRDQSVRVETSQRGMDWMQRAQCSAKLCTLKIVLCCTATSGITSEIPRTTQREDPHLVPSRAPFCCLENCCLCKRALEGKKERGGSSHSEDVPNFPYNASPSSLSLRLRPKCSRCR